MRLRGPQRRASLPDDVARSLGLGRHDRILAWSRLVGGGAVAATMQGLHITTPSGQKIRRLWVDVDRAAWDPSSRTAAVWWVGQGPMTPLEAETPGLLPEVIRDRVQASILLIATVSAPAGGWVRVALRRAADGSVLTQVMPSPGVRLDDAEVAEVVRGATSALRGEAGLDGAPEVQGGGEPAGFGSLHGADPA